MEIVLMSDLSYHSHARGYQRLKGRTVTLCCFLSLSDLVLLVP